MSGGGFFGQQSQHVNSSQNNNEGSGNTVRTVRSLLLCQIENVVPQGDGPVMIDLHPVSQGVLCVLLRNISDANNNAKLLDVSDTTGEAELRFRALDPDSTEGDHLSDYLNTYVKLYGQFRTFNGNTTFDISRVEPVDDAPEGVLYHEIEVAREWYHFTDLIEMGGAEERAGDASQTVEPVKYAAKNESLFVEDTIQDETRIIDQIKMGGDSGENGVSVEQLAHSLGLPSTKVQVLLDKLNNSGLIYELNGEYLSTV